jgi:hypothetical protein
MMEAARTFDTLVNFCQTTRSYNPEDSHLHDFDNKGVVKFPFLRLILVGKYQAV